MKRASIHGISPHVPQHDRSQVWSSRWRCKFLADTSVLLLTLTLSVTYPFSLQQVDDPAPTVSRSGRLIDLLPSGLVSLIGHNAPSLAVLMHQNIRFKKTTTKRSKVSPSVAAATLAQSFKVNSQFSLSYWFHPILTLFIHGASAAIETSSVTMYHTKHSALSNFNNFPAFISNPQNFNLCDNSLVHRQRPKVLDHRVPMPPSPVKLHPRERAQKVPRLSQSDRRQHHPLHLVQHPRSEQHLLYLIQCPRCKKYLLLLSQHLKRKPAQPMCLNRSPT